MKRNLVDTGLNSIKLCDFHSLGPDPRPLGSILPLRRIHDTFISHPQYSLRVSTNDCSLWVKKRDFTLNATEYFQVGKLTSCISSLVRDMEAPSKFYLQETFDLRLEIRGREGKQYQPSNPLFSITVQALPEPWVRIFREPGP